MEMGPSRVRVRTLLWRAQPQQQALRPTYSIDLIPALDSAPHSKYVQYLAGNSRSGQLDLALSLSAPRERVHVTEHPQN